MADDFTYVELNGFKWPKIASEDNFYAIQSLQLQHGDLVLNTYPRCGTNWTVYAIWSILNDGQSLPQPKELMKDFPFIDMFGLTCLDQQVSTNFRKMTSHVPPPFFPFNLDAKYVVTVRNPFDCFVSMYHFIKGNQPEFPDFDTVFEKIFSGEMGYGDYFDHLLFWYPHRNDSNVKFLVFEKMIEDREKFVLELAEFLGKDYLKKVQEETLGRILENISFNEMKTKLDYSSIQPPISQKKFIRKGAVGDWRNLFSERQKERLENKLRDKMNNTELLEYWLNQLNM